MPAPQSDNPTALNALGIKAMDAGDFATAQTLLARAVAADPRAIALWMNLAKAQRGRGDAEGERESLHCALRIDQTDFMALIRLAELHQRLGEHAQASSRWSAVLALAAHLPSRSAELEAVLAGARGFVDHHMRSFADIIEAQLAGARTAADGRAKWRFDACIDSALGRRTIHHNICEGLHYPFLPADEFFDREHFPWLEMIEAHTPQIRAEAETLLYDSPKGLAPYVEQAPGTPPNKWTKLDRSTDWSAYYLWKYGERMEGHRTCPATAAALDLLPLADFPRRAPTAFFSVLRPHTRIPPHTGVSNTRAIVHLPLLVPPGCGFRVGGEVREWREGTAFVFDDTIEHEAWNDSDTPRVVLIFDVWNPYLDATEQGLVRAFYDAADASGFNPDAPA
jgi:aspartyl/asparaginyl beta-hydroxylase (cupin superfamily)